MLKNLFVELKQISEIKYGLEKEYTCKDDKFNSNFTMANMPYNHTKRKKIVKNMKFSNIYKIYIIMVFF